MKMKNKIKLIKNNYIFLFEFNSFWNYFRKLVKHSLVFSFTLIGFIQPAKILSSTNLGGLTIEYFDQEKNNDYILGPGDSLLIRLSKFLPESTQTYFIEIDGSIFLPKVNRVFISGLTIKELTRLLNEKFKGIIQEPDILVKVVTYRAIKVFVDGEVGTPGMYVLKSSISNQIPSFGSTTSFGPNFLGEEFKGDAAKTLPNLTQSQIKNDFSNANIFERGSLSNSNNLFPTVFDAIKAAGGITKYSDLSSIEIIRKNPISSGGGKIKANVNFISLLNQGDINQNIRIMDEDVIRIKRNEKEITSDLLKAASSNLNPKTIKVFVAGRVEKPGIVLASKLSSLNDAIYLAGGTKFLKGKISFIRYNPNGSIEKRRFRYRPRAENGSYSNPFLKDGDVISIGKSGLNIANEILNEITQPILGIYTTTKIIEDLQD